MSLLEKIFGKKPQNLYVCQNGELQITPKRVQSKMYAVLEDVKGNFFITSGFSPAELAREILRSKPEYVDIVNYYELEKDEIEKLKQELINRGLYQGEVVLRSMKRESFGPFKHALETRGIKVKKKDIILL